MNHEAREDHEEIDAKSHNKVVFDDLSRRVVNCAYAVHKALGPGLLESAYEECLGIKLLQEGIPFQRQVPMSFDFEGQKIDIGYKLDLLVDKNLIVELKSVEALLPVHEAQILTYLKLSNIKTGLLINFNSSLFKNGIRRFVL